MLSVFTTDPVNCDFQTFYTESFDEIFGQICRFLQNDVVGYAKKKKKKCIRTVNVVGYDISGNVYRCPRETLK